MKQIARLIFKTIKGIDLLYCKLFIAVYKLIYRNFKVGNNVAFKGIPFLRPFGKTVIGAGSVVTKNVGDDEIWAGNPAKFIRPVIKQ